MNHIFSWVSALNLVLFSICIYICIYVYETGTAMGAHTKTQLSARLLISNVRVDMLSSRTCKSTDQGSTNRNL